MNETRHTLFANPFSSFWMGGFECSDKLNAFGNRVDILSATGHLQFIKEDYALLDAFKIRTVREGIRWSQVEKTPYKYDWNTVAAMIDAAAVHNIQQVWDLCHFGFPDDLTPLHPMFAKRFAAMCRSFVNFFRLKGSVSPLIVTPINEVSFLSWLGGDVRGTAPYCINNGWEVKYALMKAYIEAIAAMKEVDPTIIILSTEPLVQIVPPLNATDEQIVAAAKADNEQFQALDILVGNICPELGGKPEYVDVIGFNFYFNNQWEIGYNTLLPWANLPADPRWLPFSELLIRAYSRYGKPVLIAETSHPGEHRPQWITYIAQECAKVIEQRVPLLGVCLYPIIDRPDWDNLDNWHNAGLWDVQLNNGMPGERILNIAYADALLSAHEMIANAQQSLRHIHVPAL